MAYEKEKEIEYLEDKLLKLQAQKCVIETEEQLTTAALNHRKRERREYYNSGGD